MSYAITEENTLHLIRMALEEDISTGDVTSEAIFDGDEISTAKIVAKADGIVCGGDVVRMVYREIDPAIKIEQLLPEGSPVKKGQVVMTFEGRTKVLLSGERTALNFFQRMSGIATKTAGIVKLVEGSAIKILDTRKTLPGFRFLDKYSVKTGGGQNHRIGLYDMVMIKDNHIKAAGSITEAVAKVRFKWQNRFKIEVETTDIDEVQEALTVRADIIMLDNMAVEEMEKASALIARRAQIEISGNMNEDRIREVKHIPIDFISLGSLTHSVEAFDWSMKFE
ncbi:MAG: carboxylating nicotinate-nucleotide diphosphorylase [Spirochaetota bacterium]